MKIIAITAPAGGTGCSTLAAHAALILQARGHHCTAVELHPRNQLGVHLGLPQPQHQGWARLAVQGQWWGDAALASDSGLHCLPFGSTTPTEQAALAQLCLAQPQWLAQQLAGLPLPPEHVLVVDVGFPATPWAWQALAAADAVLCCTTPAQDSVQSLQALLDAIQTLRPATAWLRVLACRMDARRHSHTQGFALLRARWPQWLLQDVVHEDEALAQSWALGCTVQQHAPQSLSSHDLQGVVHTLHQWLSPVPAAHA